MPSSASSALILCLALPSRVICASPASTEAIPPLLNFASFAIKGNTMLKMKLPHVLLVLPVLFPTLSD